MVAQLSNNNKIGRKPMPDGLIHVINYLIYNSDFPVACGRDSAASILVKSAAAST